MRLLNGLTPHSIVRYNGKLYKIKAFYVKDDQKFADLIDGENKELKRINIMDLEKVDD